MSDPLWQQLVVQVPGPIVTAGLALFVVDRVTARAQRRRETSETRDLLTAEVTEAGDTLYFALQRFWRECDRLGVKLQDRKTSPALVSARETLDAIYTEHRVRGRVLEQRLTIYYRDSEPATTWHRAMILLSTRYFLLLTAERDERTTIIQRNAKESGAPEIVLRTPPKLMRAYRSARGETIQSLWKYPLDKRGKHMSEVSPESPAAEMPVGE